MEFQDALRQYDFDLPQDRIAQEPASPRDSAKLLVFDRKTGDVHWTVFRDIGTFLPKHSLLVLNDTRVIPARLFFTDPKKRVIPALVLGHDQGLIRVLAPKRLSIGDLLTIDADHSCTVEARDEKVWMLRPSFSMTELPSILERSGHTPLPPYIKHCPLDEEALRREYQSVFAAHPGSIAAPTASLHFTPELLEQLQKEGIQMCTVTLHVHLGTFAPLTEDQWRSGTLHSEKYSIPLESIRALEEAKKKQNKIIPVGTTVARTLESASDVNGHIIHSSGATNIFIREGYNFRLTEGLITNFHVPKSSLLMMVSALTGAKNILSLYRQAIDRGFRFYSFGDAMLIL